MSQMRIDKYLANAGLGTRTEVKNMIRKGKVTVNGKVIKSPDMKLDDEKDQICLEEKPVNYRPVEYYMFHKPAGCVSATKDNVSKTVLDYLDVPQKERLFPVGRLDKDTEGLLLITNDGDLGHRLTSPAHHVDKTYFAKIKGLVSKEDVLAFEIGLDIGEEKNTLPARLEILSSAEISEIHVTIQEGKFHQVKRMFQAVGKEVLYLKRLSMGSLVLDPNLKPGEYRELTSEELFTLKEESNHKYTEIE